MLKKGSEECTVAERIRISPTPKLGGWAGKQLRFLSISRGQSILTDIQHGSLAVNRRVSGLPSMQQMWFSTQGHSLGYTKPRGSAGPLELFFINPEDRLSSKRQLPAAVADVSAGTEHWFVACRNALDQVPPKPPRELLVIVCGVPPDMDTLISLSWTKKPMDRLSGDQKGFPAPSDLSSLWARRELNDRIHQ